MCSRQHAPALVMFADVDGLKVANDTYGHQVGDQLLQDTAATLQDSLRDADVIARIGGDEFAAVLSGTSDSTAVADRLQRAVDQHNQSVGADQFPMSIAVGCAVFDPDDPESLEVLVQRADAAMYETKRAAHAGPRAGTRRYVHA